MVSRVRRQEARHISSVISPQRGETATTPVSSVRPAQIRTPNLLLGECTGTCVTFWTRDIRYSPFRRYRLCFLLIVFAAKYLNRWPALVVASCGSRSSASLGQNAALPDLWLSDLVESARQLTYARRYRRYDMRTTSFVFAAGLLLNNGLSAAQQKSYTDVTLDHLAGPVREAVAKISFHDSDVRLPDGPSVVSPIMRERC